MMQRFQVLDLPEAVYSGFYKIFQVLVIKIVDINFLGITVVQTEEY